MGVFRGDDDELFLSEFKFDAPDQEGNTWARYKYTTESLPEFASAKFYGFGIASAMCYYATDKAVYQYALSGGNGIGFSSKLLLGTEGPSEFPITGEITMMKVLKPGMATYRAPDQYQFYGQILLVGTYENGGGYSLCNPPRCGDR